MGLFDWLFPERRKVQLLPDEIWLSSEARLQGAIRRIRQRLDRDHSPVALLVLAHFPDRLAEIDAAASEAGLDRGRVHIAPAEALVHLGPGFRLDALDKLDLFVLERHPLRAHDEAIVAVMEALPCRSRIAFQLALDDPLLTLFDGERISDTLKSLGMTDEESITSRLASRRIAAAQRHLAADVFQEQSAYSSQEWMERNL